MPAAELKRNLTQFHGTEMYHRHYLNANESILLTDGAVYIRDNAECHWLFDFMIACQQTEKLSGQAFQVWKIEGNQQSWLITCEDGNKKPLYQKELEFTDFPLERFTIWLVNRIAMLPSEY